MQSNPHKNKFTTMKLLCSKAGFRRVWVGVLALAMMASGLFAMRSASAGAGLFQSDQPQVGPGIPQVGGNSPKSALSSTKAGSVLFFHKYTSDATNPSGVNTLVTLTNTNPRDGVNVRLFFVRDCQVANQVVNLGANQTRTLMMSIEDPGKTGYIVATAINAQGVPTQFNWLIGSATLRDAQNHEAAYNAVGVAKRTAGPVLVGETAAAAEIKFNDIDYDKLPRLIAVDSIQNQDANTADASRTDVSLYSPLADLRTGGARALKLTSIAYDQSGRPYPQVADTSACYLNAAVGSFWTAPALNTFITTNRPGWGTFSATTAENTPVPVLGLSLSDSLAAPTREARQMQVLSRLDAFTMTVPVSAPSNPAADAPTGNQADAAGGSLGATEMKAGSVLLFSRYASGAYGSSRLNITNTHPTQRARVRVVFTGLADSTVVNEAFLQLNPNQTISVNPGEFSPNQKGWAIAFAMDTRSLPLNFNYLIGSGQVRETGAGAFGYNALAIAKNSPGAVPRNGDALTSDLLFNDVEFDRLSSTVGFATIFSQQDNTTTLGYARPPANLLDPVNTRGSVLATSIDELLAAASATVGAIEARLITIRPNVLSAPIVSTILKGRRGWFKMAPGSPIFPWMSNTAAAAFTTAPGSSNWTGGMSGGLTPFILATSDSYLLKTMSTMPNNQAPTANFEPIDVYLEARSPQGTIVRLDGRTSSDPNPDDVLSYKWYDNDQLISTAPVSDFRLPIGSHVIKLIVTDSSEFASEPKTTLVEVQDTTAPVMSGVPTAITKVTGSPAGTALNFPLPFAWDHVDGAVQVTASKQPNSVFTIGKTTVTFRARDAAGNESTASMLVTVTRGSATLPTNGGVAQNKLPYLNNLNDQYVVAGKVRMYTLVAEDGDNDPVTFSLLNAPPYATIEGVDPVARKATLVIAATAGAQAAATNIRVVATDSRGGATQTLPFRIQISDVENDETGSGQGPGGGNGGGGGGGGTGGGGGGGNNGTPTARVAPIPAQIQATLKQGAVVRLDGSASSDPDGDALSYKWFDNGTQIAEGAIIDVTLPAGPHAVTLKVSDGKGGENTSAVQNFEVLPRPLSLLSVSPAKIDNFGYTTITVNGTGFNANTQVRFDCTSFCSGGSQITVTINSIEEDKIVLTARTTQKTPLGNRDCIVTNPGGATARLVRSNFVAN